MLFQFIAALQMIKKMSIRLLTNLFLFSLLFVTISAYGSSRKTTEELNFCRGNGAYEERCHILCDCSGDDSLRGCPTQICQDKQTGRICQPDDVILLGDGCNRCTCVTSSFNTRTAWACTRSVCESERGSRAKTRDGDDSRRRLYR